MSGSAQVIEAGNRLVRVTERDTFGGDAVQIVTYFYDAENRWIGQAIDEDGDGTIDRQLGFAYDPFSPCPLVGKGQG